MGSRTAVAIFSIFAVGELVADKLPKTPKRTAFAPLLARILLGCLSGASLCAAAGKPLIVGALGGRTGGVIGAFVGYEIRRRLVNNLHLKDLSSWRSAKIWLRSLSPVSLSRADAEIRLC
jgi:uncharacterized membrane protein